MSSQWKGDLSFSDRISATSKMQDEYHDLIAKAVQLLVSSAPPGPIEDHHADEHIFPNLPQTGAQIGRYSNVQHHKDGIFSEIYRAVDPETHGEGSQASLVALKVTTPSMMTAPHDSHREARMLRTSASSKVIPLLDSFEQAGGRFVLVFPFYNLDLDAVLRQRQLDDRSRRSILTDVFTGLAHLHGLGIIHRDIKPSNILLKTPSGPAVISDFGISWSSSDKASEPAERKILDVGTTSYRPPELLFGNQSYTAKVDMWAMGCVVAQVVCLNEKTLFDAGDLGSELALIKSIFETMGTPDAETWPEASTFPDWGKMNFKTYPPTPWSEVMVDTSDDAVDLVRNLVVFESGRRFSAEMSMQHSYLQSTTSI